MFSWTRHSKIEPQRWILNQVRFVIFRTAYSLHGLEISELSMLPPKFMVF